MIINNYYPSRDALSSLSLPDKQIAGAYDSFAERTDFTERVKTDTLPVTIFFNCIQTMYDKLKDDLIPKQGINQLWNDLNVVVGQGNYYSENNPRRTTIDFSPKREYEKTILFGGLYAKVKTEPFGDAADILAAIKRKACYNKQQEEYFQVFSQLGIQTEKVTQSEDDKEVNNRIMLFRMHIHGMSDEECLDYCESELRIVGNNPNYPERYEKYVQQCRTDRSKKVTEAKLRKMGQESKGQTDKGVSFTIGDICDAAFKCYDAEKGFADNIESMLFEILRRKTVTDADVLLDLHDKMVTLKKRLLPTPSVSINNNFGPITSNSDGGTSYSMESGNSADVAKMLNGKTK